MNIVVCLKQTPDTAKVKFNPATRTLLREGVENIMNPFDRQALEAALELKDAYGGKVTALSMGLPMALDVLKDALAMGADEAVLISDKALAGSDTFATSLALAAAIKKLGAYDVVLCGKQAVDGDTAQVGPELAQHLGIASVTGSLAIRYEGDRFIIHKENDYNVLDLACAAPVLITVNKSAKEPRFASIKGKMKARKAKIPTWGVAELGLEPEQVGLTGSPTKVLKAYTPVPPEIHSEIIAEEDIDVAVDKLFQKLVAAEIIKV